MATDPNIFNDAIRETCTAINEINRTLLILPARDVRTTAHFDLMAKRARLDRHRQRLYRRQDAARLADVDALTALHEEQDYYR